MEGFVRAGAGIAVALCVMLANESSGEAAGALAIGNCAAYGYAFDYTKLPAAQSEAMRKCTGARCRLVASMKRSCAAFAIDGRQSCGAQGYAVAPKLGQAQNVALQSCYKFGGRDCVIRAWACDVKG
jgi:Domain of unknown function (DUF4189)